MEKLVENSAISSIPLGRIQLWRSLSVYFFLSLIRAYILIIKPCLRLKATDSSPIPVNGIHFKITIALLPYKPGVFPFSSIISYFSVRLHSPPYSPSQLCAVSTRSVTLHLQRPTSSSPQNRNSDRLQTQ